MPTSATDRRKLLLLVAGVGAAFLVVTVGFDWLDDVWFYPWASARTGRPTLTGTWVGRVVSGSGRPREVFIELQRDIPARRGRCSGCATIKGRALTCDERGVEQRYVLGGAPQDRLARRIRLGTSPSDNPAPDGLELNTLNGGWNGAGELALAAAFIWRKGTSAISSTDDPDTTVEPPLRMRRGTEADFRTACRRGAAG